ncbi:MAG: hypothetical protein R2750_02185 [Bacteroidales bacterium]
MTGVVRDGALNYNFINITLTLVTVKTFRYVGSYSHFGNNLYIDDVSITR